MSSSASSPIASGSAASTTRWSPIGSSPSTVRSRSNGAPVDQACGLHAVGYWTGYFVSARSYPPKASGRRPSNSVAASRMSHAMRAASSLNPYRRNPQAMIELSNGQTVPR